MVFKKGESGNPAGRAKGKSTQATLTANRIIADVKQLAREASKDAIDTLISVMKNETAPVAARVTAAQAVLDRGWGRPSQTIEANVNVFDRMSDAELREFVSGGITRISPSDSYLELAPVEEGMREQPN